MAKKPASLETLGDILAPKGGAETVTSGSAPPRAHDNLVSQGQAEKLCQLGIKVPESFRHEVTVYCAVNNITLLEMLYLSYSLLREGCISDAKEKLYRKGGRLGRPAVPPKYGE